MNSWELFKHFLFSSRAGSVVRSLSFVSMFAIFLGACSLILVTSVMNGLGGSVVEAMLRVEPKLTLPLPAEADWVSSQNQLEQDLQGSGLQGVYFYASQVQDVVVRTPDGGFGGGELKGLPEQEVQRLIEAGQVSWADPLRGDHASLASGEVLMGLGLAEQLDVFQGDEITVIAPEGLLLPPGEVPPLSGLKVAGVINTSHSDFDNKTLIYSGQAAVPRLSSAAGVRRQFEIRWDSSEDHRPLQAHLEALGWSVESWADKNSTLVFALRMERNLVGILLGLAALIASFSVVTVMSLLLTQKRKDMAMMMVVGLSPARLKKLFAGVGLYLCGIALYAGGFFGVVIALLVDRFSGDLLPEIYYNQSLPAVVDGVQVALILGGATLYSALVVRWVVHKQLKVSPSAYLSARKLT